MTYPDRLRELALAAAANSSRSPLVREYKCVSVEAAEYIEAASPQTILALLDRLSAAELARDEAYERAAKIVDAMADEAERNVEPSQTITYFRDNAAAIRALSPRGPSGC